MPRSSTKNKGRRKKYPKTPGDLEDGNENDECASDITQLSMDEESSHSGYAESVVNITENVAADVTEEKLKDSLENVTHKNVSIRVEALKILQSIFVSQFVPGLLENWKVTAADALERCMRKKSGDECKRAINLGVLLALQLGSEFNSSATKFGNLLKDWIADWTLGADFRAECANALGLYTFITTDDVEATTIAFNALRDVWTGIKSNSPPELTCLYCSSLNSWTLLLLNLPNRYLESALCTELPIICHNLEHSQLDARICSGETLCVLYELADQLQAYEETEFRPPMHDHCLEILEQMSRESVKYQAKRNRRLQRSSFREIYSAIKQNEAPDIKVKFGAENLVLDSWSLKLCYDSLCNYLRGGINNHLRENFVIRYKLGLGAPCLEAVSHKISKLERQILNQSVTKARTLARGKQRDKRVADIT